MTLLPGHFALHDDWVGRIEEVLDDVVVRFEDGSECLVKSADPERLIPAVGPDKYCLPRHSPRCRPSFIDLNGIT